MLRSGGTQVEAASVPCQHQAEFAAVSRTVHSLKEGEHANVRLPEAVRLVQRQALGYRRGLKSQATATAGGRWPARVIDLRVMARRARRMISRSTARNSA
jgi:hypothetical protein